MVRNPGRVRPSGALRHATTLCKRRAVSRPRKTLSTGGVPGSRPCADFLEKVRIGVNGKEPLTPTLSPEYEGEGVSPEITQPWARPPGITHSEVPCGTGASCYSSSLAIRSF